MINLKAWFLEDVSRWEALESSVQRALAKYSPYLKRGPHGGNRFGVHPQKGKPRAKNEMRNEQVLAALLNDSSMANRERLAEQFNISAKHIYRIGKRYGQGQIIFKDKTGLKSKSLPKNTMRNEQIVASLLKDSSAANRKHLAKLFKISENAVYRIGRRHGKGKMSYRKWTNRLLCP